MRDERIAQRRPGVFCVSLLVIGGIFSNGSVSYAFWAFPFGSDSLSFHYSNSFARLLGLVSAVLLLTAILLFHRNRLRHWKEAIPAGDEPVRTQDSQEPLNPETEYPIPPSIRIPDRRLRVDMIVALAIFVIIALLFLHPSKFGASIVLDRQPNQVRAQAVEILRNSGVDLSRFPHRVVHFEPLYPSLSQRPLYSRRAQPELYLAETLGISRAVTLMAEHFPRSVWVVRFFRPFQYEEYQVGFYPAEGLVQIVHVIPENVPGDRLSSENALVLAEDYLRRQGELLAGYHLLEANEFKRLNRSDWELIWQQEEPFSGEAYRRIAVVVQGSEIKKNSVDLSIPENWERKKVRVGIPEVAATMMLYLLCAVAAIIGLFFLFHAFLHHRLNLRNVCLLSGLIMVGHVLIGLLDLPAVATWYSTQVPWGGFWTRRMISQLLSSTILFAGIFSLSTVVSVLWHWQRQREQFWRFLPSRPRILIGVLAGMTSAGLVMVWDRFGSILIEHGRIAIRHVPVAILPARIDAFCPGLATFLDRGIEAVLLTLVLCSLRGLRDQHSPVNKVVPILFLLTPLAYAVTLAPSPGALFLQSFRLLGISFILYISLTRLLGRNPLAYLSAAMSVTILPDTLFFLYQPLLYWKLQGLEMVLLSLVTILLIPLFSSQKG